MSDQTETSPLPGTVFTPRQVRILKIAVIVMGIMLVAGFAAVIGTIVYQASGTKDTSARTALVEAEPAGGDFTVPPGMEVAGLALDGDRLALHLKGAEGAEIAVVDLASGRLISRLKLGQ